MKPNNKYIIHRVDLLQDPVTLISEGLLIGRLHECEVLLNHPAVSRAQAGIKEIDGAYYIFPLRSTNPIKLNDDKVEENEALAAGDILKVGPFLLGIDTAEDALIIRVSLRIGAAPELQDVGDPGMLTLVQDSKGGAIKRPKVRPAPIPGNKALDIFWDKRIREAGKMIHQSMLFPKGRHRTGKAQFDWIATSDLAPQRRVWSYIWPPVLIGLVSTAAAFWYASAFAPAPIAKAHTLSQLSLDPPIATMPNAGSCISCHSLKRSMQASCTQCHTTDAFAATVIKPHHDAGIGCVSCHSEHRGTDFKAATTALFSCTQCHNNANKNTYKGFAVNTPHGGTLGYPVVAGEWRWRGVDDTEWELKKIAIKRLPTETDQQWRSKQFHALHMQRVRTVAGIPGNKEGQLSCSSCHNSFTPIDRKTPRTRCGVCHNGKTDPGTKQELLAADQPNCTSCHVQHIRNKRHWNPTLLGEE